MNRMSLVLILLVILISGAWWYSSHMTNTRYSQNSGVIIPKTDQALSKRIAFTLADLNGQMQSISQWDNQVILLNFWATWCPPCRKEMPDFMHVYDKYKDRGFVVLGVGIDKQEQILDFINTMKINYPILIGERDAMTVSHQYGNRHGALPYSVIIDKQGMIRYQAAGLISRKQLESLIKPLL